MKSDLRHRIKQDDFRSGIEHAWDYRRSHAREVKIGLAVVLGAVVVIVGLTQWSRYRARQAATSFSAAQEVYEAPVQAELPEGAEVPAGTTTYATAAEKYQKAAVAFDDVTARFGGTDIGRRARYYAALSRLHTGEQAKAEKELEELASGSGGTALVRDLSRLALAESYRRRGDVEKAAAEYRRLADDAGSEVPRDHALMRLGSLLEDARRYAEAETAYRRVVEEFPGSTYADDARRRAASLEPAGRG